MSANTEFEYLKNIMFQVNNSKNRDLKILNPFVLVFNRNS